MPYNVLELTMSKHGVRMTYNSSKKLRIFKANMVVGTLISCGSHTRHGNMARMLDSRMDTFTQSIVLIPYDGDLTTSC